MWSEQVKAETCGWLQPGGWILGQLAPHGRETRAHPEIAVVQRLLKIIEDDATNATAIESADQLICSLLHILALHAHTFQHQLEISLRRKQMEPTVPSRGVRKL